MQTIEVGIEMAPDTSGWIDRPEFYVEEANWGTFVYDDSKMIFGKIK